MCALQVSVLESTPSSFSVTLSSRTEIRPLPSTSNRLNAVSMSARIASNPSTCGFGPFRRCGGPTVFFGVPRASSFTALEASFGGSALGGLENTACRCTGMASRVFFSWPISASFSLSDLRSRASSAFASLRAPSVFPSAIAFRSLSVFSRSVSALRSFTSFSSARTLASADWRAAVSCRKARKKAAASSSHSDSSFDSISSPASAACWLRSSWPKSPTQSSSRVFTRSRQPPAGGENSGEGGGPPTACSCESAPSGRRSQSASAMAWSSAVAAVVVRVSSSSVAVSCRSSVEDASSRTPKRSAAPSVAITFLGSRSDSSSRHARSDWPGSQSCAAVRTSPASTIGWPSASTTVAETQRRTAWVHDAHTARESVSPSSDSSSTPSRGSCARTKLDVYLAARCNNGCWRHAAAAGIAEISTSTGGGRGGERRAGPATPPENVSAAAGGGAGPPTVMISPSTITWRAPTVGEAPSKFAPSSPRAAAISRASSAASAACSRCAADAAAAASASAAAPPREPRRP